MYLNAPFPILNWQETLHGYLYLVESVTWEPQAQVLYTSAGRVSEQAGNRFTTKRGFLNYSPLICALPMMCEHKAGKLNTNVTQKPKPAPAKGLVGSAQESETH